MKRLAAAFLLLLPLLSSPTLAQNAAPWQPDPKTIFAPGVEVVSVEIKPPRSYNLPTNLPTFDNKARIVRVYDEAKKQWREFPFPDAVKNFEYVAQRSPTHIVELNTTLGGPYGMTPLPEGQWLLDTDTGEFSRPDLACGEFRDKVGHGRSVIKAEYKDKAYFLCNTATEDNVGPIPLQKPDDLRNASTSPDGKHVIMFGSGGEVYSYTFKTNTLIDLGSSDGTWLQSTSWIDDQRALIYTTNEADMSYPWRNYYLADVTKPDSLTWVTTAFKPGVITSLDHPHRTQWISYKNEKCFLTELNWETTQITDYDLNGLCTEGKIIPDGSNDRLYFKFN